MAAFPLLLTLPALAAPNIAISTPTPGQALHNVTPLITVTYDAPAPGLNLDTLQVLVNGADWTTRFVKTPTSASYQVSDAEAFIAGTLTLGASIRDLNGALASTTQTYVVHPTLVGIAPSRGPVGVTLTIAARGLDPLTDRNVLIFPSAQVGPPLRVPFVTVDPLAGTGTLTVPAGARSGDVSLEVNARLAQTAKPFLVQGNYVSCGLPWHARFLANGDLLVIYNHYYGILNVHAPDWKLTDPECPIFDYGFTHWRSMLARLTPDRGIAILRHFWPVQQHDDGAVLGLAVTKDGQRFAYMTRDSMSSFSANYQITTSTGVSVGLQGLIPRGGESIENSIGWYHPIFLDFDDADNLYFAAYHEPDLFAARLRLYRISASVLVSGAPSYTPELVRQFDEYAQWVLPGSGLAKTDVTALRVTCDGTLYLALDTSNGRRLHRTTLTGSTGDVVWPFNVPDGRALRVLPTCRPDEVILTMALDGGGVPLYPRPDIVGYLWSTGSLTYLGAVSQPSTEDGPNAPGLYWMAAADVSPSWELMAAPWWGVTRVGSNPVACTGIPSTWPCPHLRVVPPTKRWRPQRSFEPLTIHFESPAELSAAILEVRSPGGALVPADTTPLESTGTLTYKLTWIGPWTQADGVTPLSAGHYKLFVRGTPTNGPGTIRSYERLLSLVEVSEVRLEALPDAPPLDDNPAVPALVEQGQDPTLGRPGGGKRLFAESTAPGGPVHNRVKVVVVTTPVITPDPALPPDDLRVRVFLRSFDVDDPAPALPDLDGDLATDAVADNRGAPASGELLASWLGVEAGHASASTELSVSLQPGDNYRVTASTSQDWLSGVVARQNVAPAGPVQDGSLSVSGPNVSPMLTVWRALHLEIDSMAPPPQEGAPPEEYAQRNFIKGHVLRISVAGPTIDGESTSDEPDEVIPRYVYLEPEATEPELPIDDGSASLPFHGGRFEKGKLTLGGGADAVSVSPLDGNGVDTATGWEYVRAITTPPEPARIHIPVVIRKDTLREQRRRVIAWEHATSTFTLDAPVSPGYVGGVLSAAGQEWLVTATSGDDVSIEQDGQPIDFRLVDDDLVEWPLAISTAYVSDSDNPAQNIFALAYIRPRADLPSEVAPPFVRNVWDVPIGVPPDPEFALLRKAQLAAGREWPTTPSFWRSYLQGAVQSEALHDADPNDEGSVLGRNEGYTDQHGAFVFTTALKDHLLCHRADVMQHTVAHELGHQFGFDHSSGGVMGVAGLPLCLLVPDWFTAWQLGSIRSKGVRP